MAVQTPVRLTVEEYLAWEETNFEKHEYIDGEVRRMAGAKAYHNRIMMNIAIAIGSQLIDSDCYLLSSEMRVRAGETRYLYPDLSAVCGEAQFARDNELELLNPVLVVEVTSPSSLDTDRGEKRDFYFDLPSVQAYLIIDQDRPCLELCTRADDGWHTATFTDLGDFVPLRCRSTAIWPSPMSTAASPSTPRPTSPYAHDCHPDPIRATITRHQLDVRINMAVQTPVRLTVEEYLAWEDTNFEKHEYIDGEVRCMAGAALKHNQIASNASGALWQALGDSGCMVLSSDMRVRVGATRYYYPDLSAVCGDAQFARDNEMELLNPVLVVEVTSPSSLDIDRGEKRDFYFDLPSVQAYLIIDQDRVRVELCTRADDGWRTARSSLIWRCRPAATARLQLGPRRCLPRHRLRRPARLALTRTIATRTPSALQSHDISLM